MTHNFWRVRLGEAVGNKGNEKLYDLCRNEEPPCIAIGWGAIDLGKTLNEINQDYNKAYRMSIKGSESVNIHNWTSMRIDDLVVAMMVPATICAIGRIIHERYRKEDDSFRLNIVGGPGYSKDDPYGEVSFYNRIDVEWITNPNNPIRLKSLGLPKSLESKLNSPMTIISLYRNEFCTLKNKIDSYEPKENISSPKYEREYDNRMSGK